VLVATKASQPAGLEQAESIPDLASPWFGVRFGFADENEAATRVEEHQEASYSLARFRAYLLFRSVTVTKSACVRL